MKDDREKSPNYTHHSTVVHAYPYHSAIVQMFKLNIACFVGEEQTVEEKNAFENVDCGQPLFLIVRVTAVQNWQEQCVRVIRILLEKQRLS